MDNHHISNDFPKWTNLHRILNSNVWFAKGTQIITNPKTIASRGSSPLKDCPWLPPKHLNSLTLTRNPEDNLLQSWLIISSRYRLGDIQAISHPYLYITYISDSFQFYVISYHIILEYCAHTRWLAHEPNSVKTMKIHDLKQNRWNCFDQVEHGIIRHYGLQENCTAIRVSFGVYIKI